MTPRPRKKKNAALPENLYSGKVKGCVYYSYKHPITKKLHGMGRDKVKAIEAAKQLNAILTPSHDLVSTVLGIETLEAHITWFEREIIPKREYANKTLELYNTKFKQLKNGLGAHTALEQIGVKDIAELMETLTARSAQQLRQVASDLFATAQGRGLIEINPAELTNKPVAKKVRKRLTLEQFVLIKEHAPLWLQNAMDLSLITLQRREDVSLMRFDDVKDGALYVVQGKTKKYDTGYLKIDIGAELDALIKRCRDNIASPFLVHREPEKRLDREGMHWTQVRPEMITRAFKKCCRKLGIDDTSFHEIRALGIKRYKDAGINPQSLAGHSSEKMTKNYDSGHGEIRWIETETL